jgi:DNA polymerase-3 subunit delta'
VTTLADIFGQNEAIEWILSAYRADRLPHALVFAGPAGVGKASTARGLATLFLCENPKGDQPCGTCHSCTLMGVLNPDQTTNHPDYHVVYRQLIRLEKDTSKARDLSIDVIRDYLVEPAGRKAAMGRGKVFIIEEADLMNPQAQNAMLKTLEEPPGRSLLVLITDSPDALLQTIRSRCQVVRFAHLEPKIVARELEKRQFDKGLAADAAKLTEGSLGVAIRWIEDGVVESARELLNQIDGLLKGRPLTDLPEWFKKSAEAYAGKQLERDKLASKDQATKEGLSIFLRIAAQRFRQRLTETTDELELDRACEAIDAIVKAEQYLDANVNVALTLQQLANHLGRQFARA